METKTSCSACGDWYPPKSSGGLVRYSLKSVCSSPYTANKVFPGLLYASSYVCSQCLKKLRTQTDVLSQRDVKRIWNGARTPRKTPSKKKDLKTTPSRTSDRDLPMSSTPIQSRFDTRSITFLSGISGSGSDIDVSTVVDSALHSGVSDLGISAPALHSGVSDLGISALSLGETRSDCMPEVQSKAQHALSCKTSVINNIVQGHYDRAFKSLIKESPAAKRALLAVAQKIIQTEVNDVSKKSAKVEARMQTLAGDIDLGWLKDFSWSTVIDEARDKIPTLTKYLETMMPAVPHMRKNIMKGSRDAPR